MFPELYHYTAQSTKTEERIVGIPGGNPGQRVMTLGKCQRCVLLFYRTDWCSCEFRGCKTKSPQVSFIAEIMHNEQRRVRTRLGGLRCGLHSSGSVSEYPKSRLRLTLTTWSGMSQLTRDQSFTYDQFHQAKRKMPVRGSA